MGCPCEIHLYGAHANAVLDLARAEIERLEAKYSRYRDDSLISRINRSAGQSRGVAVDDETASLLNYVCVAYAQSDGLFDPTAGVLRRAWDFSTQRLPSQQQIDNLLPLIGWDRVSWQPPHLLLPTAGMQLDFGGLVKEYTADSVARLCREQGIRHGMVDLGGDLAVVGPHPDGTPWRVGIRDPWGKQQAIATIELMDGGLATSGDYERHIEVNGTRYGHILDPRSGWPVQSLVSASVWAPRCVVAGTAATVAMLKGTGAVNWLHAAGVHSLCIDRDGALRNSSDP